MFGNVQIFGGFHPTKNMMMHIKILPVCDMGQRVILIRAKLSISLLK